MQLIYDKSLNLNKPAVVVEIFEYYLEKIGVPESFKKASTCSKVIQHLMNKKTVKKGEELLKKVLNKSKRVKGDMGIKIQSSVI